MTLIIIIISQRGVGYPERDTNEVKNISFSRITGYLRMYISSGEKKYITGYNCTCIYKSSNKSEYDERTDYSVVEI